MPELFIIAGPNGAGKTTDAYSLLPNVFKTLEFVNADEIARGLSPLNPEGVAFFEAGRIMLARLEELVRKNESFAFETTLSGLSYTRFIKGLKEKGYQVTLFFVHLASIELAIERVAIRVSKGGHNIPKEVIDRRYVKGLANFKTYATIAAEWFIYDNSEKSYNLVSSFVNAKKEIFDIDIHNKFLGI